MMPNQVDSPETVPVERIEDGGHACLTYEDDATLWPALTVFTWAGVAKGQKVLLVLDSDDLRDDEAAARMDGGSGRIEAARTNGQVVLTRAPSFYMPDGTFDPKRQRDTVAAGIEQARRDGWPGFRGAGSGNWASEHGCDTDMAEYESLIGPVVADAEFSAICWYDRRRCNDYLVAAARELHPIQVMDRLNAIDVVAAPGGAPAAATSVALFTHGGLTNNLNATLERLIDQGAARFEIDLRDLSFIETQSAAELIDFAASLPEGCSVTVRCGPLLELLLRGIGADEVAQLRLVADEEP